VELDISKSCSSHSKENNSFICHNQCLSFCSFSKLGDSKKQLKKIKKKSFKKKTLPHILKEFHIHF